jgi:hypothetical protein
MRVEKGNNKNEKVFYVGDQPYRVVFTKDLKEFSELGLSKLLYDNAESMIDKNFFRVLNIILDMVSNQDKFFRDINSFSEENVQESKYINQRIKNIRDNGEESLKELNRFLASIQLGSVNDFFDGQQISKKYIETYFKDNFWFEIFCYYILIQYVRKKRNSLMEGRDYYIIPGQDMCRKGYQYQIDVILLFPKKVVLVSAKSGSEEQNHVLSFNQQKNHLDGDLGLVFFYKRYMGKRLEEKDFTKVIDDIGNLKFSEIEKELDKTLLSYF